MELRSSWIAPSVGYGRASWYGLALASTAVLVVVLAAYAWRRSDRLTSAVTALLVLGGPLLTVSILNVLPFSWPSETEFVTAPWPILFAPSGVAVTVWGLLRHRCSRVSYPSHRWLATALVVCVLTGLAALGAYTRWTMFPLVLLAWPGLVVMGPVWPNGHHHYGPLASQYGAYVVALASGVGWTLFGLSIRQLWRRDG